MALFWIFFALTALLIGFFFYRFIKLKKDRQITKLNKKIILEYIGFITAFSLFCLLMGLGIVNGHKYDLDTKHKLFLVFGSLIFGLSFMSLLITFVTYFYKKEMYEPNRLAIKTIMIISIPLSIIFLVMALDAYAPYVTFPLISGITFTTNGIKFHRANDHLSGFSINWYGIIILAGAIIAYVVCDRHFYKEYKRHGLIDALFILVFIVGILGARFWYCLVLDERHSLVDFFHFQDGGLAIMGGVIFGAPAGILYLLFFRRYINLRHAMDLILPCVLIAQAIGRWGNFFNQEVYGYQTFDPNTVWWLPEFIVRQMTVGGVVMYLPLFLIEFITNLTGYFVIMYAVRKGLNKHLSNGDLFCLYIVWYGLTRVILEPLRYHEFEYNNSRITAWIMFGGGLIGILAFHIFDYFYYGKKTFLVDDSKLITSRKNPYITK